MPTLTTRLPRAAALLPLLLLAPLALAQHARAQSDIPIWSGTPAKPAPKRKPRPPRARPAPRPPAPLLSVQYRLLKIGRDDSQVEVSPVTVFNQGDRLRIAVKSAQDVYLFVIHQPGPGQSGRIYVPDSRINDGQNSLAREREFVIPAGCGGATRTFDCAHRVEGGSGQEFFTIIFSRTPSVALLEDAAGAGGQVSPSALDAYLSRLAQKLDASGRGDTVFARRVRNTAPRSDNQLVLRLTLNKRG